MPEALTSTSPTVEGGPPRHRVRRLAVVYVTGAVSRGSVVLDRAPVTIGREPGAGGLTLGDTEVSRAHAVVEPLGDGWQIRDLGSRNGLYVDGVRATAAPLAPGAVIRIGGSLVVYGETELRADQVLEPETPALLGGSLAMQRLRGDCALVAARPVPVLVVGETGVGKERVAHELHRLSGRTGRLVIVNCAAIAPTLAESELFGHVAGAFTGATTASQGLFAAADKGTLFLDEIGELPLGLQPKILRALAVGEVRAVGATEARTVDVRIVAATHRDLRGAVSGGEFRADLLARLAGWTLPVPPLRERRDDVLGLATASLARAGAEAAIAPSAAEALLLHDWPFNVREVEQVMAAAAVRAGTGAVIRLEHLPDELAARLADRAAARAPAPPPLALLVDRTAVPGKDDLIRVLRHFGGSIARAAEFFGKDRRQVYRWLDRDGIEPEAYRPDGADADPDA